MFRRVKRGEPTGWGQRSWVSQLAPLMDQPQPGLSSSGCHFRLTCHVFRAFVPVTEISGGGRLDDKELSHYLIPSGRWV